MVDKMDTRVLNELLRNSRRSYHQIAKTLDVSTGTVLNRIRNMESQEIIKGYSVILDHKKLGYEVTAITEVVISKGKLTETEKEIAKITNVCAVYDVTGRTDAIVVSKFKTIDELSNFIKYLLSLPHVDRTNTHTVLSTLKEDFRLI